MLSCLQLNVFRIVIMYFFIAILTLGFVYELSTQLMFLLSASSTPHPKKHIVKTHSAIPILCSTYTATTLSLSLSLCCLCKALHTAVLCDPLPPCTHSHCLEVTALPTALKPLPCTHCLLAPTALNPLP